MVLAEDVRQLNRPMASLMSPSVVARVLELALRRRRGRNGAPAPAATGAYPPATILPA
jgi:hypothetical protein